MSESSFGIIGLGVMGRNLALNINDKGHTLSVYNRAAPGEEKIVSDFLASNPNRTIEGFTEINDFCNSLARPRKILIMVKAGGAIDAVIEALLPHLATEDIIIDGGNSHFSDTKRRSDYLNEKGIHFVGCGISGGEEGARNGPSLMPGGPKTSYTLIAEVLESIAAKDKNGDPCCTYIGPQGAGHFVKMIHNGIEYAEMQLIAEAYHILSTRSTNEEIADEFQDWNSGELASFLIEISNKVLRKKEGENYLIDLVLDKAGSKGTGSWSSQVSMQLGMPTTLMTEAVFARYVSSFKSKRVKLSGGIQRKKPEYELAIQELKNAFEFSRIINHHQGFELIQKASEEFEWNINLSELARIWTNGCIIRSFLMDELITSLSKTSILEDEHYFNRLSSLEGSIRNTISYCNDNAIPSPCFSSAYQYWLGMTTGKLSANMIQAQRDAFGAHTYERIDRQEGEFFHSNWDS